MQVALRRNHPAIAGSPTALHPAADTNPPMFQRFTASLAKFVL
jgi:hypothetical protein